LEALTLFFDDEKHPVAGKHPFTVEDEEQEDTVDVPRNDDFNLSDLLPLLLVIEFSSVASSSSTSILEDNVPIGASSSTAKKDLNS
jgi:hypothetical protein